MNKQPLNIIYSAYKLPSHPHQQYQYFHPFLFISTTSYHLANSNILETSYSPSYSTNLPHPSYIFSLTIQALSSSSLATCATTTSPLHVHDHLGSLQYLPHIAFYPCNLHIYTNAPTPKFFASFTVVSHFSTGKHLVVTFTLIQIPIVMISLWKVLWLQVDRYFGTSLSMLW